MPANPDPRLPDLFARASELEGDARAAWLADLRRAEPGLAREVEDLLASAAAGEQRFETPAWEWPTAGGEQGGAAPPASVGPFRIVREIGRGGMGTVFLAEQETENFRRSVALKIVDRPGAGKEGSRRFREEARILAALEHPGIARFYDAGWTEGRWYLALEYVEGEHLLAFAARRCLDTRQRVGLFLQVLDAVDFAHRHLVVHRDLKPGNILVDAGGAAKLLDFGISKMVDPETATDAAHTETRAFTPAYASPEQLRGERVTVASDVYSLGVVLYELLAGCRPFERGAEGSDPRPPSTAARRMDATDGARVTTTTRWRDLTGDLDAITLKALRGAAESRYASAAAFAADLRRWLEGKPVEARRGGRRYRMAKFARRHRVGAAAAATVLAALGLGLGTALVQRNEAVRQAAREAEARRRLEAVSAFVAKSLQSGDPAQGGREDMTVPEAMDNALKEVEDGAFRDDPETEATLYDTIANVLLNNARQTAALPLFERALAIRRRLHPGDDRDVATSINNLAAAQGVVGSYVEAETRFREALEMRRRLFPQGHSDVSLTLSNLAITLNDLGRPAEAEPLLRECLALEERLSSPESLITADASTALAQALIQSGKPAEAEPLFERSLAIQRRARPGDHPEVARAVGNVAYVRQQLGRAAEAEPLAREAVEIYGRVYRGDHPDFARSLQTHASLLQDLGRMEEAEPLTVQALEMHRRVFAGDHPHIAESLSLLMAVRLSLGLLREAEGPAHGALEMYGRMFPENHPSVLIAMSNLASLQVARGRAAEAEPLYVKVLELRRGAVEGDHPGVALVLNNLAFCRIDLGRLAEAESGARESVAMYRRLFPEGHPRFAVALSTLALALRGRGQADEARALIGEAEAMVLRSEPPTGPLATKVLDARKRVLAR